MPCRLRWGVCLRGGRWLTQFCGPGTAEWQRGQEGAARSGKEKVKRREEGESPGGARRTRRAGRRYPARPCLRKHRAPSFGRTIEVSWRRLPGEWAPAPRRLQRAPRVTSAGPTRLATTLRTLSQRSAARGGNRKPGDPCGRSASSPRERKPFLPIVVHETLELVDPRKRPQTHRRSARPAGGTFLTGSLPSPNGTARATAARCSARSARSAPRRSSVSCTRTGRAGACTHTHGPRAARCGAGWGAGCLVQSKRA